MTTTQQQTPTSNLDYTVSWVDFLGTDTIATSAWSNDLGITLGTTSNTTTTASAFFTGGVAGTTYLVTNTITTAGARTATRTFYISIIPYQYV